MKMLLISMITLFGLFGNASGFSDFSIFASCANGNMDPSKLTADERDQIREGGFKVFLGHNNRALISQWFGSIMSEATFASQPKRVQVQFDLVWIHGVQGAKKTPTTLTIDEFGTKSSGYGEMVNKDEKGVVQKTQMVCIKL